MRAAVFRTMLLALVRDPAAFAMSFVLPAAVFLIFAVIFSGASGGNLQVRVALLDLEGSDASERFMAGIESNGQLTRVALDEPGLEAVRRAVRTGIADVGVVVRGGERTLQSGSPDGQPPLLLVTDPTREISVAVVEGIVQETYFARLPHIVAGGVTRSVTNALAPLEPGQAAALEAGLTAMATADASAVAAGERIRLPFERLVARESAIGDPGVPTSISYYAGAVAAMFLLFSAMNGALSLLQEKESGLLDRLATGPAGTWPIIDGKFLFLWAQGIVQVAMIYAVAWLGFGLDVPARFALWLAVTVATAAAGAGLMLGFVALCRTFQQAQTLGSILILVASAVGGSMIPRFLIPPYVQAIGWATPNTWTLEAYGAIFWRNEGWYEVALPIAVLSGAALFGLVVAHLAIRRR
ncbi:MAG: ABC transporter permease [Rhizobiales bacterium]|nr:ABC transporter permease [Hyphomicrobiales bacterium]